MTKYAVRNPSLQLPAPSQPAFGSYCVLALQRGAMAYFFSFVVFFCFIQCAMGSARFPTNNRSVCWPQRCRKPDEHETCWPENRIYLNHVPLETADNSKHWRLTVNKYGLLHQIVIASQAEASKLGKEGGEPEGSLSALRKPQTVDIILHPSPIPHPSSSIPHPTPPPHPHLIPIRTATLFQNSPLATALFQSPSR